MAAVKITEPMQLFSVFCVESTKNVSRANFCSLDGLKNEH